MASSLVEGQDLSAGQSLESPDEKSKLYLSRNGMLTLFRFEAGRDPVDMWRFRCFANNLYGAPWVGIRKRITGTQEKWFLCGGDHAQTRETAWWSRPGNGFGPGAYNPMLIVQNDCNLVLHNRQPDGTPANSVWSSETAAVHPAAINPRLDIAMMTTGVIAISANTIVENELTVPINVSDGQTAVVLAPQETVAVHVPGGAGVLAIVVQSSTYDLDSSDWSAGPTPHVTTRRQGNTVRLVAGVPSPIEWNQPKGMNFTHLQLPWEMETREKK